MERYHPCCQDPNCGKVRVGINADGVFGWGHLHEQNTGHEVEFVRTNMPDEEPHYFDTGDG
ncbi:hypothetical protein [Haladaptatus sp. NG-WS-4]